MSEFMLKYWPIIIVVIAAIIYIIRQENKVNLVCRENDDIKDGLKNLMIEMKETNKSLGSLTNAYARISGFLEGLEAAGLELTVRKPKA